MGTVVTTVSGIACYGVSMLFSKLGTKLLADFTNQIVSNISKKS